MILFFLIIHRLLDVVGTLLYCSSAVPNVSYLIVSTTGEAERERDTESRERAKKREEISIRGKIFAAFTTHRLCVKRATHVDSSGKLTSQK